MADTNHESFRIPSNKNIKIWRYMDIAKYISLIQTRSLFFPRGSLLGDPYEGSTPKLMAMARDQFFRKIAAEGELGFRSQTPDLTLLDLRDHQIKNVTQHCVSCWHMNEYESAAMWSLYMKSNEGVCVQSTYSKLRACLPLCICIGEVNYIDYNTQYFNAANVYNFVMHKRKSFEHERELRAVLWELLNDLESGSLDYKDKFTPLGVDVKVEVDAIIESVRLNPLAPDWLYEVIVNLNEAYNIKAPVVHSDMKTDPIY